MAKAAETAETKFSRAHVITGGFPPGMAAGHDHDHARLRLLTLLAEKASLRRQ
jgi:hypothetical protein